jgi:protein phosphatase
MKIIVPDPSLVVLIGVAGSGKSTFAARHFRPTEILSSDAFRAMVSDDATDQSATDSAFDVLHLVAGRRLAARRLAVVDATNVHPLSRAMLVALAKANGAVPVAIVFDLPERVSHERNAARPDRAVGRGVIRRQAAMLRQSMGGLEREGFGRIFVLRTSDEADSAEIVREPGDQGRSGSG